MADNMNGSIMEEDNSFGGRVKKAAKRVDNFWRGVADFINPNVAREGFTPSNIARDVNMWVEPVSQMALDEAQGRAEYPAWAMALGGIPVVGKVASKVAGRVAAKGGAKAGAKGAAQPLMDSIDRLGNGVRNETKAASPSMSSVDIVTGDAFKVPEGVNEKLFDEDFLKQARRSAIENEGKPGAMSYGDILRVNQGVREQALMDELNRLDDYIDAGAANTEMFAKRNEIAGRLGLKQRNAEKAAEPKKVYAVGNVNNEPFFTDNLEEAIAKRNELQRSGMIDAKVGSGVEGSSLPEMFAKENLVPAKDFVWKHPNGEIMTVRARDLDEASDIINAEIEKMGGVPNTAEISDATNGRYYVYANPTEDGYVLSGSRGKNDKYFDNLEEAQAYMNGFPKYDYERGLMDEYKFLKAPTMKRVSNDLAENARMVYDIVKADVSYGHKLSYMTNNELQKEYEKAIKNGASKDVIGKIVREADSRGVKGTGSVFKVTGNGKYTFLDDRPNTGLLADTPAGPYNAEFVPGEGSIMEGTGNESLFAKRLKATDGFSEKDANTYVKAYKEGDQKTMDELNAKYNELNKGKFSWLDK